MSSIGKLPTDGELEHIYAEGGYDALMAVTLRMRDTIASGREQHARIVKLARLLEEMGEVAQAAGKIVRFGEDGRYRDGTPNVEQLLMETGDVRDALTAVEEMYTCKK